MVPLGQIESFTERLLKMHDDEWRSGGFFLYRVSLAKQLWLNIVRVRQCVLFNNH
jgi:hypothetical protein